MHPMHSPPDPGRSNGPRYPLSLCTSCIKIQPCIQTMQPHFRTRRRDPLKLGKQLLNIVTTGTNGGTKSVGRATRLVLSWKHEKCLGMSRRDLRAAMNVDPEILSQPEAH